MSVFIANFKASEHPIVSNIARGILIAIGLFIFSIYLDISKDRGINLLFGLGVSLLAGIVVTVLLIAIDYIGNLFDKK